eukprot:4000228-Pyramimonas_sp.AAC.1
MCLGNRSIVSVMLADLASTVPSMLSPGLGRGTPRPRAVHWAAISRGSASSVRATPHRTRCSIATKGCRGPSARGAGG